MTDPEQQLASNEIFPVTQLESLETPSVYQGKVLSLEDMRDASEYEASIKALLDSDLIGCAKANPKLATHYKNALSKNLAEKYDYR